MRLHAIAQELLDCACQALETQDACPNRSCVASGSEIAIENCCAGNDQGQLTVSVARIYPSRSFPTPSLGTVNNCDDPWTVVTYHILIARCHPVGGLQPPTCDQLEDAALRVHDDMELIRQGIVCCMRSSTVIENHLGVKPRWTFGDHLAIGPEGGCVGSILQVIVGFQSCWDC